jgi:hypothetical protein
MPTHEPSILSKDHIAKKTVTTIIETQIPISQHGKKIF